MESKKLMILCIVGPIKEPDLPTSVPAQPELMIIIVEQI